MFRKLFQCFLAPDGGAAAGGEPAPAANPAGTEPAPATNPAPAANEPTKRPDDPFAQLNNPTPAGTEPGNNNPPANEPSLPEKYEFKLPEGLQMSPEIESKFTAIAKGAKLTQEQANALVALHSNIMMDALKSAEKQRDQWASECDSKGLTKDENLRYAKTAIDTFGGGAALKALVESGLAYHPAIQTMLQNIGKLLSEDNAPDGKTALQNTKSAADSLFPNSKY